MKALLSIVNSVSKEERITVQKLDLEPRELAFMATIENGIFSIMIQLIHCKGM